MTYFPDVAARDAWRQLATTLAQLQAYLPPSASKEPRRMLRLLFAPLGEVTATYMAEELLVAASHTHLERTLDGLAESSVTQLVGAFKNAPSSLSQFCHYCGPGYRYGDEGCRHTPETPTAGAVGAPTPSAPGLQTFPEQSAAVDEGAGDVAASPAPTYSYTSSSAGVAPVVADSDGGAESATTQHTEEKVS